VKNFIKSLLITFLLFVSLSVQACGIYQNVLINFSEPQIFTSTQKEVFVGVKNIREAFVSQNNENTCEIYTLSSSKKDNIGSGNFNKAVSQNKFSQCFYISYSKQILCNSFRKISPNLENEICTRAP
jgi:hypothetical protein